MSNSCAGVLGEAALQQSPVEQQLGFLSPKTCSKLVAAFPMVSRILTGAGAGAYPPVDAFASKWMAMTDAAFWEDRYSASNTPWDLAAPAPVFASIVKNRRPLALPRGVQRIVVPGCGYGHDAAMFAEAGVEVLGADISPTALAGAHERYGTVSNLRFVQTNVLEDAPVGGPFDLLVDHTFFCTLAPEQHSDWLAMAERWVKPGGWVLGIFWNHGKPDGPPYSIAPEEVEAIMAPLLLMNVMLPNPLSVPVRAGQEWLALLHRPAEQVLDDEDPDDDDV